MMLMVLVLAAFASHSFANSILSWQTAGSIADPNPDYQYMHKYYVKNAIARGAVCNDGSPAAFYYRNCTANGDRHPGDPTDYCAKGGTQGVLERQWLVLLDPADGKWCSTADSCRSRPREFMTSEGLPDRVMPQGWFSIYPEENPNLYKQTSVYIPSCSSDLFLGTTSKNESGLVFAGSKIVHAVLEDLNNEIFDGVQGPLQFADNIVIGGGAGAMFMLDELKMHTPANATVSGACDGCVVLDGPPVRPTVSCAGTAAPGSCSVHQALTQATKGTWHVSTFPSWCQRSLIWECLLVDQVVVQQASSQSTRIFVQIPELNSAVLEENGCTGATSSKEQQFLQTYRRNIHSIAEKTNWSYALGDTVNATDMSPLVNKGLFYQTLTNCSQPGSPTFSFNMANAFSAFISAARGESLRCIGFQK
eukprot:m.460547 g.460547  ORF g.460547 m.460547 type:complete len:420 (-) comp21596_c0_seq10:1335-2594(-)